MGQSRAPATRDRLGPLQPVMRPAARQRPLLDAKISCGEVSRVMLHEFEHPCPPTIISNSGLNVCFWHKADVATRSVTIRVWGWAPRERFTGKLTSTCP